MTNSLTINTLDLNTINLTSLFGTRLDGMTKFYGQIRKTGNGRK